MAAGKMRAKLAFQKRGTSDDGFGTVVTGDFETVFEEFAELTPRFGSEAVLAGRLNGTQPYTIKVRQCNATREVDASWRAVNARNVAIVYSIVSPGADETQKGAYLEFLATVGGGGQ